MYAHPMAVVVLVTDTVTKSRLFITKLPKNLPAVAVLLLMLLQHPMAATDDLFSWLQLAQKNNPQILSAQANVAAKKHEISVAPSLADPTLSGGYFISPVETRVGPQRGKIGVSQMIPWPGKLQQKKKVAEKEYAAATEMLRFTEAKVFSEVRTTYAELYALGKERAITRDNLTLLRQMEEALLSRYATAAAQQMAVLKVQVEIATLDDQLQSLDADAKKVRSRAHTLLALAADTTLNFPDELLPLPIAADAATLLQHAIKQNPALLQARYETEAAAALVTLARQSFLPDAMIMTDYIFTGKSTSSMTDATESGKDPWLVGGSITIPLWTANKVARVNKAKAMETMQAAMAKSILLQTESNTVTLLEEYHDALRKVTLYRTTLLPQARQTIALVEEAYTNSNATILEYLDAQRVYLKLDVTIERQRARAETIAGKIDMLLGGELTRRELGNHH